LTVSAIDIDVCTGKETLRAVTSAVVDTAAGETRNKFDVRLKAGQPGDRYTREYLIQTATTSVLTRNNITAGRYIQPVTEWIQPELVNPGLAPLLNDFSRFTHLTQGLGLDSKGNIWGPLNPFPQAGVQVFDVSSCPPPTTPSGTSAPSTSSPTSTATPTTVPVDTVAVTAASWASTGGGTLTVTCTSTNVNSTQVGMQLDYTLLKEQTTTFNVAMTAAANQPGTWTFSSAKIKQPSSVNCHSKLGGSKSSTVTARRRRSLDDVRAR
jgi:hypothetical protein